MCMYVYIYIYIYIWDPEVIAKMEARGVLGSEGDEWGRH